MGYGYLELLDRKATNCFKICLNQIVSSFHWLKYENLTPSNSLRSSIHSDKYCCDIQWSKVAFLLMKNWADNYCCAYFGSVSIPICVEYGM